MASAKIQNCGAWEAEACACFVQAALENDGVLWVNGARYLIESTFALRAPVGRHGEIIFHADGALHVRSGDSLQVFYADGALHVRSGDSLQVFYLREALQ